MSKWKDTQNTKKNCTKERKIVFLMINLKGESMIKIMNKEIATCRCCLIIRIQIRKKLNIFLETYIYVQIHYCV